MSDTIGTDRETAARMRRILEFASFGIKADCGKWLNNIQFVPGECDKLLKALRKLQRLEERERRVVKLKGGSE